MNNPGCPKNRDLTKNVVCYSLHVLDASTHLYKKVRLSVCYWSVHWSAKALVFGCWWYQNGHFLFTRTRILKLKLGVKFSAIWAAFVLIYVLNYQHVLYDIVCVSFVYHKTYFLFLKFFSNWIWACSWKVFKVSQKYPQNCTSCSFKLQSY